MKNIKKKQFNTDLSLNLNKVKPVSRFNPDKIEKDVELIHNDSKTKEFTQTAKKEKIVKTTVLIPKSLHKKLKQRALNLETSISQYFNELLIKDLKEKKT